MPSINKCPLNICLNNACTNFDSFGKYVFYRTKLYLLFIFKAENTMPEINQFGTDLTKFSS